MTTARQRSRVCNDCPRIYRGTNSRCPECRSVFEKQRGSRQERGYGIDHDRRRKQAARMVAQHGYVCWRCGTRLPPGTPFDLGHDDDDRSTYRGPECLPCNRATAGR